MIISSELCNKIDFNVLRIFILTRSVMFINVHKITISKVKELLRFLLSENLKLIM